MSWPRFNAATGHGGTDAYIHTRRILFIIIIIVLNTKLHLYFTIDKLFSCNDVLRFDQFIRRILFQKQFFITT